MNPTTQETLPFAQRYPYFMFPETQRELIELSEQRRREARERREAAQAFGRTAEQSA